LNNKVIPYKFDPISETLYVLTYEPYINISTINTIKFIHKIAKNVVFQPTKLSTINNLLSSLYIGLEKDIHKETTTTSSDIEIETLQEKYIIYSSQIIQSPNINDKNITGLVDHLFFAAFQKNTSDIHIEPTENDLVIRFRVDGVLEIFKRLPLDIKDNIIARIKILAGLDISEKRKPQDGKIRLYIDDKRIEMRVSTVSTVFGEKVVLRVQIPENILNRKLEDFGFENFELEKILKAISKPYGMILITGPTGSGKTSTLYAMLQKINKPEINIMTAEDPVEVNVPGINQVEIDERAGKTFANTLRAFLRQDPDVILVGEIRDSETADIAVRAALTGHLVLSTLHTNDAPSAIVRLQDLGIKGFLISSSLLLISAQRLIRKLCDKCKEPYTPSSFEVEQFGLGDVKTIYKAHEGGCEHCNGKGYKGRTIITELLEINDDLRIAIQNNKTTNEIREIAASANMKTLFESGMIKVKKGITSILEVQRVTLEY
ncbi:MAG: GspE/PulE family protein, partial [Thermoproteota archaeon]